MVIAANEGLSNSTEAATTASEGRKFRVHFFAPPKIGHFLYYSSLIADRTIPSAATRADARKPCSMPV